MHRHLRTLGILSTLIILIFMLTACGMAANKETASLYQEVSMDVAKKAWEDKKGYFIDVRTPGEYSNGHVPGAVSIPLDKLATNLEHVPKDKKVYVICRSGNRSKQAAELLNVKGFNNIYNVIGGMGRWDGPVTLGNNP